MLKFYPYFFTLNHKQVLCGNFKSCFKKKQNCWQILIMLSFQSCTVRHTEKFIRHVGTKLIEAYIQTHLPFNNAADTAATDTTRNYDSSSKFPASVSVSCSLIIILSSRILTLKWSTYIQNLSLGHSVPVFFYLYELAGSC